MRILLVCLCGCLGLGGTVAEAKKPIQASPRAVEHNNRGALLIEGGRLAEAEFELRTAIQLSPDYAEAHNNLGIVYKQRSELEKALEYFSKAASLDKKYTAPLSHMGAVYLMQGKFDEAISVLQKAVRKEPTFDYAIFNLGLAYLMKAREEPRPKPKTKWYREAEKHFITATQLNTKLVEAHVNLGDLYRETGDLVNAEIRYKLALEDDPNNPKIYQQLAEVQRQLGKTQQANAVLRRGQEVQRAATAKAHFDRGVALTQEGETLLARNEATAARAAFKRAVQAFQQALRLNGQSVEATYALGVVHERLGDHAAAEKAWERTLKLMPNHPGAHFNLGTLALRAGRSTEGLIHYCEFLRVGGTAFPEQAAHAQQQIREQKFSCHNY